MTWLWAALAPHPPILVPAVGQGREKAAVHSLAGTKRLTEKISARPNGGRPDLLLILSPHQPYVPGALFLNTAKTLSGGLKRFGAPQAHFTLTTDQEAAAALADHLAQAGLPVAPAAEPDLTPDHATVVPLQLLAPALPEPPPVLVANPIGLTPALALALGQSLAAFQRPGQTAALLASGDLSHRLRPDAPAGYHPDGAAFDHGLMEALATGTAENFLAQWPPHRLEQIGECGYRSALALAGLAGGPLETLSYEGPFGVGYGLAWWSPEED